MKLAHRRHRRYRGDPVHRRRGAITIRLGDGAGGFPEVRVLLEFMPADELRIADVDGDGAREIIAADHVKGNLLAALNLP